MTRSKRMRTTSQSEKCNARMRQYRSCERITRQLERADSDSHEQEAEIETDIPELCTGHSIGW